MPDDVAPSPHVAYDRHVARSARLGGWWRRLGQLVFYVVAALIAGAFGLLIYAFAADLGQPRIWGTFTHEDCEPRPRGGCREVGTWVSQDGSLVKEDVYLDGGSGPDGTTPASYQPSGIISDETNNIVHVPALTGAGLWLSSAFLIGWLGYVAYKALQWGDLRFPSRRTRTRIRTLDTEVSDPDSRKSRRHRAASTPD
ncbi:hypothetical protein GCM10009775_17040 [Microbacterium aoyamense]|uniref:Transmembrane protein n=1 Tax=Microbacterium aoyamense TaxID=344166 RepID=A0ABN2PQA9_9MICO